jgi:uncharacterized phage infection (PIP) family protein YhgE
MNRAQLYKTALISLFAIAACDGNFDLAERSTAGSVAPMAMPVAEDIQTQAAAGVIQQRLIRTATGRLEVDDVDNAVKALGDLVRRVNGVVSQSEVTSEADYAAATFVARVPAESLDSVINALKSLGDVRSISTSSTDVSREYFDVETRLAVKEASVRRLTQLMGRASRIEDLVAVERELSRATAELESLKGQITYFDRTMAHSELRLHLIESGSGFGATVRPMTRAFRNAAAVFGQSIGALLYLIVFLIPWVALALILWPLATRLLKRVRRKRNDKTA